MYIIIWKKKVYGPSESLKGEKNNFWPSNFIIYFLSKIYIYIYIYYILNYFKSLIINKHLIEIVQATYPLKE